MVGPLTRVLVKIFAKGFYRVHAGLFTFFFVTFITYWFFIYVLNENHLAPEEKVAHNLLLVLTILSSPPMAALVLLAWLFFTVKSWNYVIGQMANPTNQFLYYSSTSADSARQFKSWFIVQLMISLPMVGYGLFSVAIGIIYDYYAIPAGILAYVVQLALISAAVYVRHANKFIRVNLKTGLPRIVHSAPKPFFTLFLYQVIAKFRVTLLVTKSLCWIIIVGGWYMLADVHAEAQVAALITLGIATAHTTLIFQSYRFELDYLGFSRNFPYGRPKIYFNWALTYLLLTLPENSWLFLRFDLFPALILMLFNLGTGMLFRNLLYAVSLDMKKFLYWVFFLFNLFFLIILAKLFWLLIVLNLFISMAIFQRYHYRPKSIA